jgi:hypothetical protein
MAIFGSCNQRLYFCEIKAELARECNGLVEGWNTRELRNGDVLRASSRCGKEEPSDLPFRSSVSSAKLQHWVDQPVLIDEGGRRILAGLCLKARASSSCTSFNNNTTTVPFSPIR